MLAQKLLGHLLRDSLGFEGGERLKQLRRVFAKVGPEAALVHFLTAIAMVADKDAEGILFSICTRRRVAAG